MRDNGDGDGRNGSRQQVENGTLYAAAHDCAIAAWTWALEN